MARRYPICNNCGAEINPNKYEDCEKCYISGGQTLCRDCFLEFSEEYLRLNTDDFAELVGVMVRGIE